MGGVRVGLCSCGGGGGGDEWGFKNVDFFMGGVQFWNKSGKKSIDSLKYGISSDSIRILNKFKT